MSVSIIIASRKEQSPNFFKRKNSESHQDDKIINKYAFQTCCALNLKKEALLTFEH